MLFSVRSLVPFLVVGLAVTALASSLRADSRDTRTVAPLGSSLSARGLWADARGNTVLVSERLDAQDSLGAPDVELRFLDAHGRTAWMLTLGQGAVSALVDDRELLYLALSRSDSAAFEGIRTQLLAVAMDTGQMRWRVEIEGEVTDLLADGAGGLRARSLRSGPGLEGAEHLLSLKDGRILWNVALND